MDSTLDLYPQFTNDQQLQRIGQSFENAKLNLVQVNNDIPAVTRATIERYRAVWREAQGGAALPKMGMVRFIVVADSDAEAMQIARRAYLRWRKSFLHLHELHGTKPASTLNARDFDTLVTQGQAVAGSPSTVAAFLKPQIADSGANYVVGQMAFGDLSLAEMLRSVDLFGAEVMPALRT